MMKFFSKLETVILNKLKGFPNLPVEFRNWLGNNVWWIVLIGAILTAISALTSFSYILTTLSVLGTVAATYYTSPAAMSWSIVTAAISLVFLILEGILLATAVKPLREKQKKGWVLLFATWLLNVFSTVVGAILTLGFVSFVITILFGAIWIAIGGYLLFEIHSQFAHVERSNGTKSKASKK